MCIRDSFLSLHAFAVSARRNAKQNGNYRIRTYVFDCNTMDSDNSCLLYTSDAADERSSVDLGGRRIIKNKTTKKKQNNKKKHTQ